MVRVMFLLPPSTLGHSVGKRLWLPSLRGSPFTKSVNTREVFRQQPGHWKPLHRTWVGFGRFSSPFTEDSKITAFLIRPGYLTGGFHHLLYKRKTAMHHRTISLYSVTAEPASVHPRSSQPSATASGQQQLPKPVLQSKACPSLLKDSWKHMDRSTLGGVLLYACESSRTIALFVTVTCRESS